MKLVGLVSSYCEGSLLRECLRSLLDGMDAVYLYEGPFGDLPRFEPDLSHHDLRLAFKQQRLMVKVGQWESESEKRTEMVRHACRGYSGPVWGVILDADEVLLWPQYLRDICERLTEELPSERYMNIKLVEMEGTVVGAPTHLVRLDLIERYFVSASQILFKGDSFPVALGNVPATAFPMQGEPHILHRSPLRGKERGAPELRAHLTQEADWFELAAANQNLRGVKPGD